MIVSVMSTAERHRKYVTDFAAQRLRLCEPDMVGVRGTALTDQAGLTCYKFQMGFVTEVAQLGNYQGSVFDRRAD